jgi:chaperone modulatory protein CbpM
MMQLMISETEVVALVQHMDAEALRRWVDLGWVLPQRDGEILRFDQADVARVRLICELHYELHIEEDSMSVVLSLMDQLYETRRSLNSLLSAVGAQPADVRAQITALVRPQR